MATFQATIRFESSESEDAAEVRRAVEQRLRASGLEKCSVVRVERQQSAGVTPRRSRIAPGEGVWRRQSNTGGVLLVAAAAWALWFFWRLSGYLD